MTAVRAVYVAHLPGAENVDMLAAKGTARVLTPEPVYRGCVPPLVVETYAILEPGPGGGIGR